MNITCLHCGNSFEGENAKFCNDGCRDSHIEELEKRLKKAVDNDPNHTKKLSDDL